MVDKSNLKVYDRIDIEPIELPSVSRLYSLEPIGIGTPLVESISGYVARLAEAHCVTPKRLIMGEIAPLILGDKYDSTVMTKNISTIFGNSDAKPAINGMRDKTKILVDVLEQLTLRRDLRYLSCFAWKGIIKERKLFRQHKAWCPECLDQFRLQKHLYEPLLWSFKDITYCSQHNCQLMDCCPHCDSSLKAMPSASFAIANNSRVGFCSRCKKWLGKGREKNKVSAINLQSDRPIVRGIEDLITVTSLLKSPPTLSTEIKKLQLIQFYFERAVRQDLTQLIALGKIMEQLKIAIIQHNDKPLSLVNLLIPVCDRAQISIRQFFLSDFSTLSQNLDINFSRI